MKKSFRKKAILALAFLTLVSGGLVYWKIAQGVTRTWDGGGADNNWNTPGNWSGDTVPTSSDTVVFDSTSTKNCTINVTLTGGTAPAGISINTGYTGTITQASGVSITIGSSGFSQAVGTFTGGNSTFDINGNFSLSGGTFTSTSGTLEIGKSSGSVTETIFLISGGTFNHNTGTTYFNVGNACDATYTVDVPTTLTLYNVSVNLVHSCEPNYLAAASGDTIIAANDFTITNGALNGAWEVQGNVIIGNSADGLYSNTLSGTLTMTGTGTKTYTYSAGGTGPHLRINNSSLTVQANAGTTNLSVAMFSLVAGIFTAPTGTMTVGYSGNGRSLPNATIMTITSGTTFNHNNGTVYFNTFNTCNAYYTIDVPTTLTLYDVEMNLTHSCEYNYLQTASGDTIIISHNFIQTNGALNGTWEVQGNYTVGSGADGGTAGITFTGGNAQTYTDQGGNEPDGDVTINKSAGTVTLASNADWNATNQDVTLTAGTLAQSSYTITTNNFTVNGGTFTGGSGPITINGSFALSSGVFTSTTGTFSIYGNFTHTAGGTFNHNNGTVAMGTYGVSPVLDVATSETFNNLTFQTSGGGSSQTVSSGDTLVVLGTFNHASSLINTGTIEARGNVIIGAIAGGGSATLSFLVSGDQTITGSGGITANLNINKPSGTVSASGDFGANSFTLASGTFTSTTGTLTIFNNFTHTAGGTFNHNNGTVAMGTYGVSPVLDVATSETFNNLTFQTSGGGSSQTVSSGDTLVVLGTLYQSSKGVDTGALESRGNVIIGAIAGGGSATLSFTGSNNQTYTDLGGDEIDGDITINKTPGSSVTLLSTADWNASGQDLTITSGELNMGSTASLSTTTITIAANGHLSNYGTGDLTLGGTLSNSGVVRMRSNDTCGGTDSILIRSSSNGVQRSWNGTGLFILQDVDVKDMAGTAGITVYSSTNNGNNGANWTFSGAACPVAPPESGLSSGKMRMISGKLNLQ